MRPVYVRLSLPLLLVSFFALASGSAQTPVNPEATNTDGSLHFAELGNCSLSSGAVIRECRIGYRTWGRLNADGTNAVLIPAWFTGTSEAVRASFIGADQLADPAKYFVIAIDPLGDGVSSSPSNSKVQPRMLFPAFTIHDMVETQYRAVTETLKLKHLHAVMGGSMGGMQTFAWMVQHPEFLDEAIPVVGSPKLTAHDLLLWQAEEDAVRAAPGWNGGNYAQQPAMPLVEVLHQMNLTTPARYNSTVSADGFDAVYAGYEMDGAKSFDANNRIYQLEAMMHQDVAEGGAMEEAAKRVRLRVLVVASEQDHMVNPAPALAFAKRIGARVILLHSDAGHLAPGAEGATLGPQVRAFLDER